MKDFRPKSLDDLKHWGIYYLTSEGCLLNSRRLFGLDEKGANIMAGYLGINPANFEPCVNTEFEGQIRFPVEAFESLSRYLML